MTHPPMNKRHKTTTYQPVHQRMNKLAIVAVLAVSSTAVSACQHQIPKVAQDTCNVAKPCSPSLQQQVAHTLIVMYEPTVNMDALNQVIRTYRGTITHEYTVINGLAVRFPDKTPMMVVAKQLRAVPGVTSVEFDSIQTIQPVTTVK